MSKFTQLSRDEVQFLVEKKLGRTEWAVYCCLASHCLKKDWSNPNIGSICKWIGGSKSIKTVEKALKGLVDKGVIMRGHRSAKKRWILVFRQSTTSQSLNSLKVGGKVQKASLKVGGSNSLKDGSIIPSKFDPIKEKEKKIEDISKSNEGEKEESRKELIDILKRDWKAQIESICNHYEQYSEITGHIVSNEVREEIKRIWATNYSEEHKKILIEKKLKENPFSW